MIIINMAKEINKRISEEFCKETLQKLSDSNLITEYTECKSVKNAINKLSSILEKYHIDDEKKSNIINDYLVELIPPGTKGVIRGNKFNKIIKDKIIGMKLDDKRFDVQFERQYELHPTEEIPDWYIYDKTNDKVIIGMNQLDLWQGGQQINRGMKYLVNNRHNTKNSKLLCVVCNNVEIKSNNKKYTLFEAGFKNNTLCYIKGLFKIINKYFDL